MDTGAGLDVQRVVVALDGTLFALRALAPARLLAGALEVPIELVTVRYGERRAEVERELRLSARNAGIEDVGVTIMDDEPIAAADGLAEMIKPHSLVCMTTHARRGVALAALGSVAHDLVRRIHEPIVLVGPSVDVDRLEAMRTMLVCVDGSDASHRIVPAVAEIARRAGAAMRVVEVAHPARQVREREIAEGQLLDVRGLARVSAVAGVPVSCGIVESADTPSAIIGQAADAATVIAAVTHARRGLARAVLGSTTTAVVAHATVPVLVFRPAGLGET